MFKFFFGVVHKVFKIISLDILQKHFASVVFIMIILHFWDFKYDSPVMEYLSLNQFMQMKWNKLEIKMEDCLKKKKHLIYNRPTKLDSKSD